MSIIKRKTGVLGGSSKINIVINDSTIQKLKHNEEYTLTIKEPTTIQVKQFGFGSKKVVIKESDYVEITINPLIMILYPLAILLAILGPLLWLNAAGVLLCVFTLLYSSKNWFKLIIR
ncbi:hypothetical protein UAY_03347 [Enterococcus moraviensis ATCC BAA-383]|uniref:PEGA domain-containing protein n=1 Tax=Enterococcus moraviensis ATCC BAA-383 TaxID=1158609 RepID=R2SSZ4_9ENTE|nr:hypothetical protein [Enterococcus moraviensis]EOH95921.1 hypothetical protein UAY_03347 [Enterococcus moraviensis ATCC BAA-383]EOT66408.1 hypothetical protein I586_02679 [Enterococcus moraviensis ATCC BAA-383]OJG67527.1 hypothetical protein RV09_GL002296 [Enterococcus moraviensis]